MRVGSISVLNEQLEKWTELLPPWLRWDGEPSSASDANLMELRAIYNQQKILINFPALPYAMDIFTRGQEIFREGFSSHQTGAGACTARRSHVSSKEALEALDSSTTLACENTIKTVVMELEHLSRERPMRSHLFWDPVELQRYCVLFM